MYMLCTGYHDTRKGPYSEVDFGLFPSLGRSVTINPLYPLSTARLSNWKLYRGTCIVVHERFESETVFVRFSESFSRARVLPREGFPVLFPTDVVR